MRYADRSKAGKILANALTEYAGRKDAIVLALPRGGVPVGYEVARALDLPLDVFVVRKLGVPGQRELAMGAIATGGVRVLNEDVVAMVGIPAFEIDRIAVGEQRELERRELAYRGDRPTPDLEGKVVLLVDDGIATGATVRAAILALRRTGVARIVLAVPVAPASTIKHLRHEVDDLVCPMVPPDFYAIGLFYNDFSQTSDDEVRDLLASASSARLASLPAVGGPSPKQTV